MSRRLLERREDGTELYYHYDHLNDVTIIEETQDVEPYLDSNKQSMINLDVTQHRKGDLWHMASIPNVIINKWLIEDGIDVFSKDPDQQKKVKQKLNSPEWRYLRVAPGRL